MCHAPQKSHWYVLRSIRSSIHRRLASRRASASLMNPAFGAPSVRQCVPPRLSGVDAIRFGRRRFAISEVCPTRGAPQATAFTALSEAGRFGSHDRRDTGDRAHDDRPDPR